MVISWIRTLEHYVYSAKFLTFGADSNGFLSTTGSTGGGVKIRPIRLPQREKVSASDDDEAAESGLFDGGDQ